MAEEARGVEYYDRDFEWEEIVEHASARLAQDTSLVDPSERERLEREGDACWDRFYATHNDRFFKDRNYLLAGFEELDPKSEWRASFAGRPLRLLECGCGAGNTLFSLLRRDASMWAAAFDYSAAAVQLVRESPHFEPSRCVPFVCDIERSELPAEAVPPGSIDVATLVFALSAMSPAAMPAVVRRLRRALRPGGLLLVRDYGRYDLAQLRFKPGHKLDESYYVRGDGTRVFYFTREQVRALFEGREGWREGGGSPAAEAPFECLSAEYCTVRSVNRKLGTRLDRVWVRRLGLGLAAHWGTQIQAKFRRT